MNFSQQARAAAEQIRLSWLPKGTIKSLYTGYRVSEYRAAGDPIKPVDTKQ